MTTSIQFRTPGTVSNTATTSLTVPNPSGAAAGDFAIIWYVGGGGYPDSAPSGWRLARSADDGSVYTAWYEKKLTPGDVTAGSVALTITAAGKKSALMVAGYSSAGDVTVVGSSVTIESTTSATHATTAVTVPGPGAVISLLGLKDTSSAVSGTYTAPSGTSIAATSASTGASQTVASVAVNTGGDVTSGVWGSGTSWGVKDAAGTTAVGSNHAVVATLALAAVVRPTADVTVPSGATFTGGSTIYGVTGDDDPSTYVEFGSGTMEEMITVGSTVPSALLLDYDAGVTPTSTSVTYSLYLGATLLLSIGTDSTLIGNGTVKVLDISSLSSSQQASILADPTNLRLRAVYTVS